MGYRPRWDRSGFDFGTAGVQLVVPSREGGENDEAEESEDDGKNSGLQQSVKTPCWGGKIRAYRRYGKTTASLNVDATQIRFNGSWSTVTISAKAVAFELQM